MKKFLNITICFILTVFLITGCSEQKSVQGKHGHFEEADELIQARYNHTATLLPDGNVLIAGGHYQWGDLNSAEIYLTKENRFVKTGNLNIARSNHLAISLKNGKVLIFGGRTNDDPLGTTTIESYDFQTGQFSLVGHLLQKWFAPQGVILDDGRVFVYNGSEQAEIYNPITNKSKYTSQLNLSRTNFSLANLKDGEILIIGGSMSLLGDGKLEKKVAKMPLNERGKYSLTAELYDSKTDTYKLIFGLNKYRSWNKSILLPNGNVLIVGGVGLPSEKLDINVYNNNFDEQIKRNYNYRILKNSLQEMELFNPSTQKSKIVGILKYAVNPQELNLINGKYLLITGGSGKYEELIDLSNYKTLETPQMIIKRGGNTATNITPNKVLIVGGTWFSSNKTKIAEIFEFNDKGEDK